MPIIKENEQQKVIKGSEKDSFKRYIKQQQAINLPTLKPILYTKNKTESNAFITNRDFGALEKTNTFSKQQNKLYQFNYQQKIRLDAKGIVDPAKKLSQDPNSKFLNQYHEMSKALTQNRKLREKIRIAETIETKNVQQENLRNEEKKLNSIFNLLHKDQRQIIDFYSKLNKNDYQKPIHAAAHSLINHGKQKIFI